MSHNVLDLAALTESLEGEVIRPDHPDYDSSRTTFYAGFDQRPAAFARVVDAADVARVVNFAAVNGIEVAVKSGGHSTAGHSLSDGGIVIDLSAMKRIDIDPDNRTAWAEAGVTAGELTSATAAHGLVIGFGDTGSVGIGGITLAGGIGYLVRKYGLAIDNLLAAEVVTADGQILTADQNTNPDLFWALRGGGGNFGVVTRFQYRLHELGEIVGGMMALPATPEVVAGVMAQAEAASEDFTVMMSVMVAPPAPFFPPELHGKSVTLLLMAHIGDPEDAERTLAGIRSLAEPLTDFVGPMKYEALFDEPEGEEFHPFARGHNVFLDEFGLEDARAVLAAIERSPAAVPVAHLRVLGGAYARVPVDATAFAHRQRKIMANIAGMYMDPADADPTHEWAVQLANQLRHGGEDTGYGGFIGDDGDLGARRAYPEETWNRLREIKQKYDPGNLFHRNHNIRPA